MIHFFQTKKLVVTHSGSFHADDVFAAAILDLYFKKIGQRYLLVRTRDEKIISKGDIVFDVGGEYNPEKNIYDHHQRGRAGERENGIKYAACGLIWKHFGQEVAGDPGIVEYLDKKIFQSLDAVDNGQDLVQTKFEGVYPYSIPGIVASFNPTWKEEEKLSEDKQFKKAVILATQIIKREIANAKSYFAAQSKIMKAYEEAEDKRLIVMKDNFSRHDILGVLVNLEEPIFFVYPKSKDRGWKLEGVRKSFESNELRKDLPASWAGLRDGELAKLTGVSDAVFCHDGLFLASAKSFEGALALAKLALKS